MLGRVCSGVMGFMWVGVVGEGWGCLMLCGTLVLGVCVDIVFFDGWSVRMLGFFLDLGSGKWVDRPVVESWTRMIPGGLTALLLCGHNSIPPYPEGIHHEHRRSPLPRPDLLPRVGCL